MPGDWWRRHIEHTIAYAGAAKHGHAEVALKAELGLGRGIAEWGNRVEKASGKPAVAVLAELLMGEHITAAKLIADRGPVNDPRAVQVGIDLVVRNVADQAKLYAASIRGFPMKEFQQLFGEHGTLTAQYMAYLAADDNVNFAKTTEAARQSGAELDQFTDKYLR